MEVIVKTIVTDGQIAELLTALLEGNASNYWLEVGEISQGDNDSNVDGYDATTPEAAPFNTNGKIVVFDMEGEKEYEIAKPLLHEGMQKFAVGHPGDFGDFIAGDYGDNTADLFIQYTLLGEVVYA